MLKSVIYKEECQIYFHYALFANSNGISLIDDFNFINETVSYFGKSFEDIIYPTNENINRFNEILNVYQKKIDCFGKQANTDFYSQDVYEKYRKLREKGEIWFDKTDITLGLYENIFDAYNIHLKKELIQMIVSSKIIELDVFISTRSLNEIELFEKRKFKNQAEIHIFILTKAYFRSEIFKKDFEEVKDSNKQLIAILDAENNEILEKNEIQFEKMKIVKLNFQIKVKTKGQSITTKEDEILIEELKRRFPPGSSNIERKFFMAIDDAQEEKFFYLLKLAEISLKKVFFCKKIFYSESEMLNEMYKSHALLFFITNGSLKSNIFKNQFKLATTVGKDILCLYYRHVDDAEVDTAQFEKYNLLKLYEPITDSSNKYLRFLQKYMISNDSNYFTNLIDIEFTSITEFDSNLFSALSSYNKELIQSIISSDEILLLNRHYSLTIFNINSGKVTSEIRLQRDYEFSGVNKAKIKRFCWIDHLNQVFIIVKNKYGSLYEKCGSFIRNIDLMSILGLSSQKYILSVYYNRHTKETYIVTDLSREAVDIYILDYAFNLKFIQNLKHILGIMSQSEFIFTWSESMLSIYDSNFKYLTSFVFPYKIENIHEELTDSAIIYVETVNRQMFVYDLITFLSIGTIDFSSNRLDFWIAHNKNMIFRGFSLMLASYKIKFEKKQPVSSNNFICTLDPYRHHLYKNPYLLPCNNKACLDCIYKHLSSDGIRIKCNFESCRNTHFINVMELESDLNFNELMKEDLLKSMLLDSNKFLHFEEMENSFENNFLFLEEKINIRMQTLFDDFDNLANKCLDQIKVFENRLLMKKNKTINFSSKLFKLDEYKLDIGTFYDEFSNEVLRSILRWHYNRKKHYF